MRIVFKGNLALSSRLSRIRSTNYLSRANPCKPYNTDKPGETFSLEKKESWQKRVKMGKYGQILGKTGQNRKRLGKTGQNRAKPGETGKIVPKQAINAKPGKIDQHMTNPHELRQFQANPV